MKKRNFAGESLTVEGGLFTIYEDEVGEGSFSPTGLIFCRRGSPWLAIEISMFGRLTSSLCRL